MTFYDLCDCTMNGFPSSSSSSSTSVRFSYCVASSNVSIQQVLYISLSQYSAVIRQWSTEARKCKQSQATQCNKPKNIKRNKRQSLTDAVAESAMLNRMICQHLNFESSKQTAACMLKTMPNTDKILSIHIHYALTHSLELG